MEARKLDVQKKKRQMLFVVGVLLIVLVIAAYRCTQATTNLEASLFGMLGGVFLTLLTQGIRSIWKIGNASSESKGNQRGQAS